MIISIIISVAFGGYTLYKYIFCYLKQREEWIKSLPVEARNELFRNERLENIANEIERERNLNRPTKVVIKPQSNNDKIIVKELSQKNNKLIIKERNNKLVIKNNQKKGKN